DIGDDHHFRMLLDEAPALEERRLLELAETGGESHQRGVGELLVAKQKDVMREPRRADPAERFLVHRRRRVDAPDLRTDRGGERFRVDAVVHYRTNSSSAR